MPMVLRFCPASSGRSDDSTISRPRFSSESFRSDLDWCQWTRAPNPAKTRSTSRKTDCLVRRDSPIRSVSRRSIASGGELCKPIACAGRPRPAEPAKAASAARSSCRISNSVAIRRHRTSLRAWREPTGIPSRTRIDCIRFSFSSRTPSGNTFQWALVRGAGLLGRVAHLDPQEFGRRNGRNQFQSERGIAAWSCDKSPWPFGAVHYAPFGSPSRQDNRAEPVPAQGTGIGRSLGNQRAVRRYRRYQSPGG